MCSVYVLFTPVVQHASGEGKGLLLLQHSSRNVALPYLTFLPRARIVIAALHFPQCREVKVLYLDGCQ